MRLSAGLSRLSGPRAVRPLLCVCLLAALLQGIAAPWGADVSVASAAETSAAPASSASPPRPDRSIPLPPALWAGDAASVSGELLARASLRKVKYARVLARRSLLLPPEAAAWPSGAGRDAIVPGGRDAPAPASGVRRLELSGLAPGGLAGFNEVRLDALTADPDRPGLLGLAVELSGGSDRQVFVSDPLEAVDRLTPEWVDSPARQAVPVARADWTAKGPRYQLARLLDRAPDALWRTSQDGLSAFLQRRFDLDLMDVGALDVVLTGATQVQVNLVVFLEGRGKTVLDWYAIPKRSFELGDGRSVLRLYLGRHLRQIAPGIRVARLKEAALMFFRQSVEQVARERGVEKLLFAPSGLDAASLEAGLPRDLPARMRELFSGRGELAVSVTPMEAQAERTVKSLAVLQSPADPEASFVQTLEAARLVSVGPRREIPALLAATAERCASFGAECDIASPEALISQEPLWSLEFPAQAPARPGEGQPAVEPERRAVHPALAQGLIVSPGKTAFSLAPDGLTVESFPGGFSLETGAAFTPQPGRTYSLWLELGRLRQGLAGVQAQAYGGGRSVSVPVKPGSPTVFAHLPPHVEGVRLVFSGTGQETAVTLRRVVLQSLADQPVRENLFAARYLFDEARRLAPVAGPDGSLILRPHGPVFAPQWLTLDLETAPWTAQDRPARLEVTLGPASGSFPLPGASSRLSVYLPGLKGYQGLASFLASPEASPSSGESGGKWPELRLRLEGRPSSSAGPAGVSRISGGGLAAADGAGVSTGLAGEGSLVAAETSGRGLTCSRAVLTGQRLASWSQVLGAQTLLELAGTPRRLEGLDPERAALMAASGAWQPMGAADLPRMIPPVVLPPNPWLELEAVLLTRASGPDLTSLGAPVGQTASERKSSGRLFKAALALLAAALCWLVLRRGRFLAVLDRSSLWLSAQALAGAGGAVAASLPENASRGAGPGSSATWKWWLAGLVGAPVVGLALGAGAFGLAVMLGPLLAVPLWRDVAPRLAGRRAAGGETGPATRPWNRPGLHAGVLFGELAKSPPLQYCTGFLAAMLLASAFRLAGAAPLAEYLGLCGLWLFLCAVLVHVRPHPSSSTSGSAR